MDQLVKTYDPHKTEDKIYEMWLQSNAFQPKAQKDKKPFTIVIPPPNVTGSLHMGHALNNTIQDILIRRSRMKGVPTLWVPGTDHAGIATQNVVEKQLAKEGLSRQGGAKAEKSRQALGRKDFEKEIWQWVDEYGHIITDQLKKLGCSCDWNRQRFTMDDDYSKAVSAAFKHYYDKGWIYQGERVINWCVHCQTALSDIEVEHKKVEGKLWFIKYGEITIATTRPETMLGDTAVAVHPNDQRYKDSIGQKVILPLVGREIPIVADEAVDPKFGTGAVKVTPAHDMNDFEIGERHKLPSIKAIDETGKITQIEPQGFDFTGQKILEARENIVKELEKQGCIEKTQDYTHPVPHCYRCGRIIEQLLSKQWFLKMKELAKPAIRAVESGEIKFYPERWKKVYLDWMENCHDWCISRQIWWGHRLPVFEKTGISNSKFQISNENLNSNFKIDLKLKIQNSKLNRNGFENIYVGDNPPNGYKQVNDVLDTWFSSALWPFAVLGWPEKTKDLKYFYPTTILSTARDIIYLWVARMIFSGFEFMGERPFSTIYIHPTIFNISGKRMSKSLGTGVDPLDLIEKYGADAVRFGLTYINTGTQDIKFDEKAIIAGSKFCNKLWNIARFILLNLQISNSKFQISNEFQNSNLKIDSKFKIKNSKLNPQTEADKKILTALNTLIDSVNHDLDNFRFGQAAHELYDFIWHDFADRYIEISKKEPNTKMLLYVLTASLKLLHPLMPYLTEEIWQTLLSKNLVDEKMLILAQWPEIK